MSKRKMIFKKNLVAHALVMAFGASVLTIGIMPSAMAQSNASGTLYGTATSSANSVIVKNNDTNATRTVTVDANGKFQATSMPIGSYTVTAMKGSSVVSVATVEVLAGQGVEAIFVQSGTQTVTVAAKRSRIDVTNASNGATFTARELDRLPVARNLQAVIQLSPNTTKSDPGYGAASFAGGGASENAYNINGYPVTNSFNQLGSSDLPFGAISQVQVLVGGYGAEFGRAVGGVVNVTTKSGTNRWEAGGSTYWAPNAFRSTPKDIYYPKIGAANTVGTDGKIYQRRADNTNDSYQVGAYVGGPIIEDKLFMFVSAESTRTKTETVAALNGGSGSTNASGWSQNKDQLNRYMAKIDWNISDDHRIEFTSIGDLPKRDNIRKSYKFDKDTGVGTVGTTITAKEYSEITEGQNGGVSNILRYIGNFTENLTFTTLVGQTKADLVKVPVGYNPTLFQVASSANTQYPGLNYNSSQSVTAAQILPTSRQDQKAFRLDLEYRLGQHTIRGGLDKIEMSSIDAGSSTAGGGVWQYARSLDSTKPTEVIVGTIPPFANDGPIAKDGYYVGKQLGSSVSSAFSGQSAIYIEDKYQVTKDLLLAFGIRSEGFYNSNKDKVKYIEMKNMINPRFSAAWDVNGDASFKVFGSAGRYTVPLPAMIAIRGANGALNTTQYFSYTGTDSNGLPTGLKQLSVPLSSNSEFGLAYDPVTLAAKNLKANLQDEISLGFERAYSPTLNFGVKGTYRTLKSSIDDLCDANPIVAWAKRNNVSTADYVGGTCQLFNPGEANTFVVNFSDGIPEMIGKNNRVVTLSAADIGMPKVKRTYTAIDVFLEHPFSNGWYGKVNYTLSRNAGNTEGQTRSDGNGAQGDIGMTATADYALQTVGSDGLLPNDRTHQIKAFGVYEVTSQFAVGANFLLSSGRPISCQGSHPYTSTPNYSSANFFCFGLSNYKNNVLTPRGSLGRTAWENQLDLNFTYKPDMFAGLSFKFDIFNVLNNQYVSKVNEVYNTGAKLQSALYGGVAAYNTGRTARLTAQYNHKF